MSKRLSFVLAIFVLLAVVVVAEFLSRRVIAAAHPTDEPTSTPSRIPKATGLFDHFPTHRPITVSSTSIPLRATYTLIPGETPDLVATLTLLPLSTDTLLPSEIPPSTVPTLTLIPFPSGTGTPFRGSPTPQVPVASPLNGKTVACYKGPSLAYIELDRFDKPVRVAGKDATGQWWYILIYKGQGNYVSCWVSGDLVTVGGDLSSLSVTEPESPQITRVTVNGLSGEIKNGSYTTSINCDDGLTNTALQFSGQIAADGPMKRVGFAWDTTAPVRLKGGNTPIAAWDAPATIPLDVSVPSRSAVYSLSLRTTFPLEVVGTLQVIVQCK